MPSKLLGYNDEQEPTPAEPEYYDETRTRAMVYNDNYMDDQEIMEFGEYPDDPENYVEGWMKFYELTPNTNYTLCIYLQHVRTYPEGKEEEVLNIDKLSYRTFSTKPVPTNLITFTELSSTLNEIHFQFRVHPNVVGAEIGDMQPDPNQLALFAEINGPGPDSYYDSFMIENIISERTTDYLLCSGSFVGLTPSTTYTLKILQSREQEYVEYSLLGQTTVATGGTVGQFMTPETTPVSITIGVVIPNEYVYEDYETPGDTPESRKVYVAISYGADIQDTVYVYDEIEIYDDNNIVGYVTFESLRPETEYTLRAETSINNEVLLIAYTTVTTDVSETHFDGVDSPYKVQLSMTTGNQAMMPIKLSFVDTGYIYGNSFSIHIREVNGDVDIMTADLQRTTKWQYAALTGDSIRQYLDQEVDVYIYDENGSPQTYSNSVYLANADENEIYDIQLLDLESDSSITFSNNDRQFDYNAYYLYPNYIGADDLTIVFQDASDDSYEFVFTLGGDSYPTGQTLSKVLDQPYTFPTGVDLSSYQQIVSAYGGRTYKVYARWLPQSGTTTQQKLLYEGITFNFE